MSTWFRVGVAVLAVMAAVAAAFFLAANSLVVSLLAAAAVAGLLCLWDYRIGLAMLLVVIPVSLVGERWVNSYKVLFSCLIIASWLAWRLLKAEDHRQFFTEPFLEFAAVFLVMMALSVFLSGFNLKDLIKSPATIWLLFFVFKDAMRFKPAPWQMVILIVIAMALEAALGLFQFVTAAEPEPTAGILRVRGTVEHANIYAKLMVMALIYLAGLIVILKQPFARWVAIAVGVLMAAGLLVSFSRNGFVSLAVGMACFFSLAYQWRIRKVLLISLAAMVLAVNFMIVANLWPRSPYKFVENYAFAEQYQAYKNTYSVIDILKRRLKEDTGRDIIWDAGRQSFLNHPIFGCGYRLSHLGLGETVQLDYDNWNGLIVEMKKMGQVVRWGMHPHNFILQTLVEMGLVGLGLIIWFYYLVFKKVKEQLANLPSGPERVLVLLGAVGLMVDLFSGMVEPAHIFGHESSCYFFVFNTALVFWGGGAVSNPNPSRLQRLVGWMTGSI